MDVFTGHDHKSCRRISFDALQGFFKRPADHMMGSRFSGAGRKLLPVFDHCHFKAQHDTDPDDGQGYMTGSADHQLSPYVDLFQKNAAVSLLQDPIRFPGKTGKFTDLQGAVLRKGLVAVFLRIMILFPEKKCLRSGCRPGDHPGGQHLSVRLTTNDGFKKSGHDPVLLSGSET